MSPADYPKKLEKTSQKSSLIIASELAVQMTMTAPDALDREHTSIENLRNTQKVLRIVMDFFQLSVHRPTKLSFIEHVPIQLFTNEKIPARYARVVLDGIDGVKVMNDQLLFKKGDDPSVHWVSRADYDKNFYLQISSLDDLNKAKKIIDNKLRAASEKVGADGNVEILPTVTLPTIASAAKEPPTTFRPRLSIEKGRGCLQIYRNTRKHPIAGVSTRKFKLLKCLFSVENSVEATYSPVFQKYDRIFETIRLIKDQNNGRLRDVATMRAEMCSIIENTIKELQKIKALQGYLKFEWRNDMLRIEITLPEGSQGHT